jgi:DNA-binding NarL/FixJ family response regulator
VSEMRLLVVDDHEVVRQGVRAVLTQYVGWEVCGEPVDGEDAIAKAKFLLPDVIILDIRMSRLGGLEVMF